MNELDQVYRQAFTDVLFEMAQDRSGRILGNGDQRLRVLGNGSGSNERTKD